jgi:tripartite-type tricarboxylate transporter receptor subunit TctC
MPSIQRRQLTLSVLALMGAASLATPALAQAPAWPSKPLRIIVPYPPGGSSDIIARAISQPLSEAIN